jgi:hypothetical protein
LSARTREQVYESLAWLYDMRESGVHT